MNKGSIVERGKHDELVALDGAYKKLVERQLVTMEVEAKEKNEELERLATMSRLSKTFRMRQSTKL